MASSPLDTLSRGLKDAPENTDRHRAMFGTTRLIPNTWGNLASQLTESGHVEPSIEAICHFLGIGAEDFGDPTLRFTHPDEIETFEINAIDRWTDEYQKEHKDDDTGYINYLTNLLEKFHVSDGAEKTTKIEINIEKLEEKRAEEAVAAEAKIRAANEKLTLKQKNEYHKIADEIANKIALLNLERDSITSSTAMPLNQFVEYILRYEGNHPLTQDRILTALGGTLKSLLHEYPIYDAPQNEVVIGEEQISMFIDILTHQTRFVARKQAEAKWKAIKHLFYAEDYREHPLFNSLYDH